MTEWCGVILAGGKGTRLYPLTRDIPKPMITVTNRPMIHYAIDLLRYAGINKIIIVVKHFGDKIKTYVENIDWQVDVQVPNVDSLDTADALKKVSQFISSNENIIVSMADIVTNVNVKEFMEYSLNKNAFSTISMLSSDMPKQFGVIVLDQENKIHSFLEKPGVHELYVSSLATKHTSVHLHSNLINTGLYYFKNQILDILNENTSLMDFGKHVFPYLLENNYDLFGYIAKYYWMDAGNPKFYLYTNWDLLRKWAYPIVPLGEEVQEYKWIDEKNTCKIHPSSKIDSHVVIGKNTNLNEEVVIENLSSIGNNVEIGNQSRIRESVIWDDVKIGSNCLVKSSVICNNVVIEDEVTIIDWSIIPPNSRVPKGIRIRNRIYEDDLL